MTIGASRPLMLLASAFFLLPALAVAQDSTVSHPGSAGASSGAPTAPPELAFMPQMRLVGRQVRAHAVDREVEGELVLAYPDSILLQTMRADSSRQVMIPLGCLDRLEYRDGSLDHRRAAWHGAKAGLLAGLAVGTALWALSGQQESEFAHVFHGGSAAGAIALFGFGGAAVGGIIGSTRAAPRWTPVPLPRVAAPGETERSGSCRAFTN
ncbi:MAG TPA: hypothetical protein VF041_00285 [Gemmatimonadaceae bacterium]